MLQLLQTNRNYSGGSVEEYGEFLHLPGKRFYDFAEIRKEIQVLIDWCTMFCGFNFVLSIGHLN